MSKVKRIHSPKQKCLSALNDRQNIHVAKTLLGWPPNSSDNHIYPIDTYKCTNCNLRSIYPQRHNFLRFQSASSTTTCSFQLL